MKKKKKIGKREKEIVIEKLEHLPIQRWKPQYEMNVPSSFFALTYFFWFKMNLFE